MYLKTSLSLKISRPGIELSLKFLKPGILGLPVTDIESKMAVKVRSLVCLLVSVQLVRGLLVDMNNGANNHYSSNVDDGFGWPITLLRDLPVYEYNVRNVYVSEILSGVSRIIFVWGQLI